MKIYHNDCEDVIDNFIDYSFVIEDKIYYLLDDLRNIGNTGKELTGYALSWWGLPPNINDIACQHNNLVAKKISKDS